MVDLRLFKCGVCGNLVELLKQAAEHWFVVISR